MHFVGDKNSLFHPFFKIKIKIKIIKKLMKFVPVSCSFLVEKIGSFVRFTISQGSFFEEKNGSLSFTFLRNV